MKNNNMTIIEVKPKVEFVYFPVPEAENLFFERVQSVEPLPEPSPGVLFLIPPDYVPYADPERLAYGDIVYQRGEKLVLAVPVHDQFFTTREVADALKCSPQVVGQRQRVRRERGIPTGRVFCNSSVFTAQDIELLSGSLRGKK